MTIIKREAPRAKVTANVRHSDCNSHLYKLFDGLDFVSCSSYPLHNNSDTSRYDSFFLDLMRGINGRSFWVMEQHSDSEGDSLPMIPALVLAGLAAAFFAFLIGLPVLRLKSDYLAIATLGFAEIMRAIFQWDKLGPLTNGSNMLHSFPNFNTFNIKM